MHFPDTWVMAVFVLTLFTHETCWPLPRCLQLVFPPNGTGLACDQTRRTGQPNRSGTRFDAFRVPRHARVPQAPATHGPLMWCWRQEHASLATRTWLRTRHHQHHLGRKLISDNILGVRGGGLKNGGCYHVCQITHVENNSADLHVYQNL